MHAGRACACTDRTACFEKKYQTRDFVYPAGGSVGKRDRTSEIGRIPLKSGYLDSLHLEIPEGALDKFRGGAEEFIAGTRVFPPKSPICGTIF